MKGQTWIPKNADKKLHKFSQILSTITVTNNSILSKDDCIILVLAHRGSHPGITGIQRRLKYHFFFHNLNNKVHEFVQNCHDCQAYNDKKTHEPLAHHTVPDKNWSKVSSKVSSRFSAGKIVTLTKAERVIPALAYIYNNNGNPECQLWDNGPPFHSSPMSKFCASRNIEMKKIPPLHPSANPVEKFMKSVGKAMKIAQWNGIDSNLALTHLLSNYRDSPHPATGL